MEKQEIIARLENALERAAELEETLRGRREYPDEYDLSEMEYAAYELGEYLSATLAKLKS